MNELHKHNDKKKREYTIIYDDLIDPLGISGNELIIFSVIYGHHLKGNKCYLSMQGYADKCGTSRNTARNVLLRLEKQGYIQWLGTRLTEEGKACSASVYAITQLALDYIDGKKKRVRHRPVRQRNFQKNDCSKIEQPKAGEVSDNEQVINNHINVMDCSKIEHSKGEETCSEGIVQFFCNDCSEIELDNNNDNIIGNTVCVYTNTGKHTTSTSAPAPASAPDSYITDTSKDNKEEMKSEQKEKSSHNIVLRLGEDGLLYQDLKDECKNVELSMAQQLAYIAQDSTYHNYDQIRRTLWPHLRFSRAAPYRYSSMTKEEFAAQAEINPLRLYNTLDDLNATAGRGELLPNNLGCFFEYQHFSSL